MSRAAPPAVRRSHYSLSILLIALALSFSACSGGIFGPPPVVGSGVVRSEPRPVAGVRGVEFSLPGDLDIKQGPAESLTLESDDNILPLIETTMRGDTLEIGTRPGTGEIRGTALRVHLVVTDLHALAVAGSGHVTMPELRTSSLAISLSGSGSIHFDQLHAQSLDAGVSGSGDLSARRLETDKLTANLSGSGSMQLAGQTRSQEISLSGSGRYTALDLSSKDVHINVSGSGTASLACDDSLAASVSGSGRIDYAGSPSLASSISGSGAIEKITR